MVVQQKVEFQKRIDENNNRTDYDHREIKFIRYDDGNGNFTVNGNDNGNASGEFLTFSASCNNVKIGDYAKFSAFRASPIKLSNNVITGLAIDCKIDDFSSNNTLQ
jgi:hypothetical protein